MKTLFLLLIIYSLQYGAFSHDTSTITYKNYPKKVHPDPEHFKLINAGSYFKKNYKSKAFTRFEPVPVPELANNENDQKPLAPSGRDSFDSFDFPAHIKSRVKKVPYFNDKESMRSKRAVNESNPAVTTSESTSVKPTVTFETSKPKAVQSTVAASPKNDSISRRSAPQNVKGAAKKRPVPPKVGRLSDSKTVRSRSIKRQGAKKNVNPKRALRKRKSKWSISRAGKPQAHNVKNVKQARKPIARQASKLSGKQSNKVSAKKPSKLSGRQGSKHAVKPASKPVHKLADKKPVKPAAKRVARSKNNQATKKARRPAASRRLISARDARPEDYPYMLSIQKDNEHWCSGAILNPQLIVSTANCFWKSKAVSRMKVRAGARSIDTGGQVAYIAEVRKHPNWSIRKDPANDIALALLDRLLKFSDAVHGLDLPNFLMRPPFDDAWVTSYGAERRDGVFNRMRLTLQMTHMRLMSDDKCNNITSRFGVRLDPSFFCLEQVGRRAPCTRDTGAPAVSDGVLWGLASWGIRKLCGTERFPAVFTDVSYIGNMNFIINATKEMMSDQRLNTFLDRLPVEDVLMRPVGNGNGALSVIQVPDETAPAST